MNNNKPTPERFEAHLTVGDNFSWLRTRLAIERTMMAWLRTGAALIGFGFTIVEVFQRLQSQASSTPILIPDAPRVFGLALIGSGVIGILVALWQYHMLLNYLWSNQFRAIAGISENPHWAPLFSVSAILAFIGVVAFGTVLFRLS